MTILSYSQLERVTVLILHHVQLTLQYTNCTATLHSTQALILIGPDEARSSTSGDLHFSRIGRIGTLLSAACTVVQYSTLQLRTYSCTVSLPITSNDTQRSRDLKMISLCGVPILVVAGSKLVIHRARGEYNRGLKGIHQSLVSHHLEYRSHRQHYHFSLFLLLPHTHSA